MAFDIGYSQESINALIDIFENKYKLIKYNTKTRELAMRKWERYNLDRGGKPMIDCINKELKGIKDKSLINYVIDSVEKEDIKNVFYKSINENNDTLYDTLGASVQEKEKEEYKYDKASTYKKKL